MGGMEALGGAAFEAALGAAWGADIEEEGTAAEEEDEEGFRTFAANALAAYAPKIAVAVVNGSCVCSDNNTAMSMTVMTVTVLQW